MKLLYRLMIMELRIGCTGWSYEKWIGSFYPTNLANSNFLKYYSSIFDTTEINSTYYRVPNQFTTKKWFSDTPKNFLFTAKFPKKITHELRLRDVKADVSNFLRSLEPLRSKVWALVFQLPPSLTFTEAKSRIEQIFSFLPKFYRYPIEGRHESWFTDEAIDYLSEKNICLVWNEISGISNPAPITSDYVYLRLIGDRTISEDQFGKIRRNKTDSIRAWAQKINNMKNRIAFAIAFTNNHLEGFAPESANKLRIEMGLRELLWHEKMQKTLSDF